MGRENERCTRNWWIAWAVFGAPCTSGIMRLRAGAALLLVHSAHSEYYLCSGGYEPVGEKCLQLTGSGYTFDECATTECPKRGGHIAAIASQEEFDALFTTRSRVA